VRVGSALTKAVGDVWASKERDREEVQHDILGHISVSHASSSEVIR